MKRPTVRVGDLVMIDDPRLFLRCGYPLHIPDVQKQLEQDGVLREMVTHLMNQVLPPVDGDGIHPLARLKPQEAGEPESVESRCRREIMFELARLKTICDRFGGDTRSIYLGEPVEDLRGQMVRVKSRRIVKTGERFGPGGGWDYEGGYDDYEPGGLGNEQVHVILRFEHGRPGEIFTSKLVEIPRAHVHLPELWGFRHKSGQYLCRNQINTASRKDDWFKGEWGGWSKEEADRLMRESGPGKDWKMVLMQKGEPCEPPR